MDVLLGLAVSVNVTLAIAEARSDITVSEEVSPYSGREWRRVCNGEPKQISEIPNPGNDLTYIVQTTPGVVMNTDVPNSTGMNFSILGMPSTSYLYSIDGVDDPATGALGLMLGQNQIQEATVVSTGYSGQFGNAAGGNINYITKSGNNQFHGNAQYYWNGRVLDANDWFNNAFGVPRPFDIANQWAGSFGGPIKRDKLFFFKLPKLTRCYQQMENRNGCPPLLSLFLSLRSGQIFHLVLIDFDLPRLLQLGAQVGEEQTKDLLLLALEKPVADLVLLGLEVLL